MKELSIPALDQLPQLIWKEKLAFLTYKFLQQHQTECPLEHIFEPGVYIRELRIPAGTLFIGRVHRHGHRVDLLAGSVVHITEAGKREICAPFSVTTTGGDQMVFYALTNIVGRSFHPNPSESRDAQALEDDAFESVESLKALGLSVDQKMEQLTWQA